MARGSRAPKTLDTRSDVHVLLAERDLLPIQVPEKKSILQYEITKKKVKPRDLMHFSRQLGVFIRAGIPIINALEVISSEMTDKVFKPALDDIMDDAAQRLDLLCRSVASRRGVPGVLSRDPALGRGHGQPRRGPRRAG